MLTLEQKRALPKRKINRKQMDAFYILTAGLNSLLVAVDDLEPNIRLIPNGWRDLKMICSRMEQLCQCTLHTFEPEKQRSVSKQMQHMRIKTVFAPEAHRDPEMFMLPTDDLALLIHAATQECKLYMCPSGECAMCRLGKVLDSTSFVSRGNRAWWEVFEQATRKDVGMEVD